jgi:hypothetical protein
LASTSISSIAQICILTEDGELIERRVRTEMEQFAEALGARPRAHIVIESATESEWVARAWKPWAIR